MIIYNLVPRACDPPVLRGGNEGSGELHEILNLIDKFKLYCTQSVARMNPD